MFASAAAMRAAAGIAAGQATVTAAAASDAARSAVIAAALVPPSLPSNGVCSHAAAILFYCLKGMPVAQCCYLNRMMLLPACSC
jgi:hypothetical protein